jgi:transcriptional regulator with XRE-family HTH domain
LRVRFGKNSSKTGKDDRVPASTHILEEIPDRDTVGGRLMRAREASGLTVKRFAWRLGVNMATVKAWESDRSMPSSHRLATIAGLFGVSLSWILHGVGTAPSEEGRDDEVSDEAVERHLDRLKALHAETGALIERLQANLP